MRECIQCGTCSAVCPLSASMDYQPNASSTQEKQRSPADFYPPGLALPRPSRGSAHTLMRSMVSDSLDKGVVRLSRAKLGRCGR
jgi:ferredoxin